MIRIVFASDSHLNKHYARMSPEQLASRRKHLREAWAETVDHALDHKAQIYIHGGDLFDGPNPRASELIWTAGQFQRLGDAGITSLLIGGNHDIPKTRSAGATPQRLFQEVRLAHVFTRPTAVEWWTTEIEGTRLAIGGLPPDPRLPRDSDPFEQLVELIEPPDADIVLLVTHYAIEGTLPPQAEEATNSKASIAALEGKVDRILVGHVHGADDHEVGGVKVHYPGPTERLSFGEMDLRCGFLEIEIDGQRPCRCTVRRRYIDPQPMRRETLRATDVPLDDPDDWLIERLRAFSASDQILQLRLEGPLPREVYQRIHFRDLWRLGQELNFYFDLDRHLLSIQADADPDLDVVPGGVRISPRGEIGRVADGLAREAEDDEERALLEEARQLVLDQYGSHAVEEG